MIPELKSNRISCFSFSKEFSMTGFRIGYVYADNSFLKYMLRYHSSIAVCATRPSQIAAISALESSRDCVKNFAIEL